MNFSTQPTLVNISDASCQEFSGVRSLLTSSIETTTARAIVLHSPSSTIFRKLRVIAYPVSAHCALPQVVISRRANSYATDVIGQRAPRKWRRNPFSKVPEAAGWQVHIYGLLLRAPRQFGERPRVIGSVECRLVDSRLFYGDIARTSLRELSWASHECPRET